MDESMHHAQLVHLIYNTADVDYRLLCKVLITALRIGRSHHVGQGLCADELLHQVDPVTLVEAINDLGQLLKLAEFLESFYAPLKLGSSAFISFQDVALHRRELIELVCCLVPDQFGIPKQ